MPAAEAMRSSYRVDAARRADEDRSPGLLVLDAQDDVELSTPQADTLLALLVVEDPARRKAPAAALSIAAEVRSSGVRRARTCAVARRTGWSETARTWRARLEPCRPKR